LDHELLEWSWRLPDQYVLGKRLLKRAARGRVPNAILLRRKSGFANPVLDWLRGPLHDPLCAALEDKSAIGPLGARDTRALLDACRRGAAVGAELWTVAVLELWHRGVVRSGPQPLITADRPTRQPLYSAREASA